MEDKESSEADLEGPPPNGTKLEDTQDRTLLMRERQPPPPPRRPEKQSSKGTLKKRITPTRDQIPNQN